MVLIRLRMKNFICYRDEEINFEPSDLWCLCGENGAGKSTILDAITWSLWGKARVGHDHLIHQGEREMSVTFTFEHKGQIYRVMRKREKGGRPILTFELLTEPEPKRLTKNTIRDTEAEIKRVLGIDYETFINSSFLLQNKADEFTKKTPQERKEILSRILRLERYKEAEERAKERAREKEGERKKREGRRSIK